MNFTRSKTSKIELELIKNEVEKKNLLELASK